MKRLIFCALTLLCIITSCDETTEAIGSSLTDGTDKLNITTSTFYAATESVVADSIISRSTTGYLGKVKDPETGTYITCNLMTQFHPFEKAFPEESQIVSKNQNGEIVADSCQLFLLYTSYYGDSLALMKCRITEMASCMEESKNYYTFQTPRSEGLLREDGIRQERTYTLNDLTVPASEKAGSDFIPYIRFDLNDEYTDKNGAKYSNYGTYLMRKFYENKEDYTNTWRFTHNVCPGFYLENIGGVGSMAYAYITQLNVYFHYKDAEKDTIYSGVANFAGTEEVIQNTDIVQDKARLQSLADNKDCAYIKTPAGIYARIILPVDSAMRDYSITDRYELRNDTLNTVRLAVKRINNKNIEEQNLPAPKSLLVIPDTLMKEFFEKEKVCDYRTSLLSQYDSSINGYSMNNISSIFNYMARTKYEYLKSHPGMTSEEYNQLFPNWNKLCLVPVTYSTTTSGTSTVITRISHDMTIASTRLEGGDPDNKCIKVNVIYSSFSK